MHKLWVFEIIVDDHKMEHLLLIPHLFMGMNYLKLYVLLETIGKKKKKNNILHTLGIT